MDLALDNLQWLICHKTRSNQTKPFNNKLIFITANDTRILPFLVKHFINKININYYSFPNSTTKIISYSEYNLWIS